MSGRKYDYSNELAQDAPQSENEERKAEARTRRLEERSTALADEFRDLKPEIGRAYNLLQKLVSQTGTFATTMLNLHNLLKNDLPLRFSEEDRKMLQDELNSIARKAAGEIRKNEKRVSIPQAVFSCMVILLILLSVFFALVIFANRKLIHSDILTELVFLYSILIVLTLAAVAYTFSRQKQSYTSIFLIWQIPPDGRCRLQAIRKE